MENQERKIYTIWRMYAKIVNPQAENIPNMKHTFGLLNLYKM